MPQASNNQMSFLRWHGIELPKPQTQRCVTWKVRQRWSQAIVSAIITYLQEGNGAGPGNTLEERLIFYVMTRRLYEGRYVVKIAGKEDTQYLILQIYPKSPERVLWEAMEYGISLREVDPFWFDCVSRGEPPDYKGHIQGLGEIGEFRLLDEAGQPEGAILILKSPKQIGLDLFPLVTTKETLLGFIRSMTEAGAFEDSDYLPMPRDVANSQELIHKLGPKCSAELSPHWFKPVTEADVVWAYIRSHYVKQEGDKYIVVARRQVVYAA